MHKWAVRFFLILVFLIPLQKRFSKPFRDFFNAMVDPSWNIPSFFERGFGFYTTDIPLLLLMLCLVKKNWREMLWEGSGKFLILFLGVAVASILGSSTPAYPLHYLRLLHFIGPIVVFAVVSRGWIDGRKALGAIVAVALLECGVGIAQYFLQDSIGLKFFGEPSLTSRHGPGSTFTMSDGTLWIIDHWLERAGQTAEVLRASGTLPHANILGGFLVFSLVASYFFFGKKRGIGLVIAVQIFTLFITYSRAAMYAGLIATTVWFFLAFSRKEKPWPLFFVILGSAAISFTLLFPQLLERGGVVSYTELAKQSDLLRLSYQDVAFKMIADHPFLGIGFDHFLIHIQDYGYIPPSFVHNIYLLVGSETGLLGLACFGLFIFSALWKGWKSKEDPVVATSMAIFIGLLALGFCDFYPIFHQQGKLLFFLAAGLISLKVVVEENREESSSRVNASVASG